MTIWQILGALLFLDDTVIRYHDFGKFDHVHHWHIGVALMLFFG
jgi:hypothetical protein